MPINFDYRTFEDLSKGKGSNQIQYILNTIISELSDYLTLQPLIQNIIIKLCEKANLTKGTSQSILDFGVNRVIQEDKLLINIVLNEKYKKFLPFILLREACYSFTPKESSELVKICINQIIENHLNKLSVSREWKKLIRDSMVNRDFIYSELDRLQKFFKIEAKAPLMSVTQFFFKEMRENLLLCQNNNINRFYDIIFERYTYKTSRSLFDSDIIEVLRSIIQIFYETRSYLSLSDYKTLFKEYKEKNLIYSALSLRRFTENIQWINRCSSIAPSYDVSYSTIGLLLIYGIIKFNPLLEKAKIKKLIEEWFFLSVSKFLVNSFTLELSITFHVPNLYLKDLLSYFNRLEEFGYIIEKKLYTPLNKTSFINLNYFTDKSNIKKIIDINSVNYKKNYEIELNLEYPKVSQPPILYIFDYTILERVRTVSVTGLTFDKRVETLNAIKGDVENELRIQINFNRDFKNSTDKILSSTKLTQHFLQFLKKFKDQGFFNSYFQLNDILNYINLVRIILNEHPEISDIFQLQTILNSPRFSQNIEEQLLIKNKNIKKIIFRDFLPLYFKSESLFRKEIDRIQTFYNFLDACYNLKIVDLNKILKMVKEPYLVEDIHRTREKKYEDVFKSVSSYKITNERIESTIEAFLNHDPPIIKPILINTIYTSTFAKYYPEVLLKDTIKVRKRLKKLRSYFPRLYIYKITDLSSSKNNYLRLLIYLVNIEEKNLFLSILFSNFGDAIIKYNRYFWRGVMRRVRYGARDFYDFQNGKFFYSEDLYKQILIYSLKILGDKLDWPKNILTNNLQEFFWSSKQNMNTLVKTVKNRISHQEIDFNLNDLGELVVFREKLENVLIDRAQFIDIKVRNFFQKHVNCIEFLPAFQQFGFSQYYLYFRPFFYKSPTFEIDFRLLFINSFQSIKYPACIQTDQAIISEYIFPYKTPNRSYLNWLVKSKKNVSEYCLFYKKKFYDIIHFNRNLTKEGWNYSSIRFKSYMQDVLFKSNYDPKISEMKVFDLNEISGSKIYGCDTPEYDALTHIYNTHSIDIKTHLGTRNYSIINKITELLKKKLIFPYISLKNLDFQDKISIILPDIKQEYNDKIIKIFSFFNICRIFEIEGEFYIFGFQKEIIFENGLLIEIWFPKCELDEFFNVFDLLFQYLEIKHHIILADLVNGKNLLKKVYGNLNFLKDYNPLLNFNWNAKDKIWMNHKLFNEKFEPIYPDLVNKDNQ